VAIVDDTDSVVNYFDSIMCNLHEVIGDLKMKEEKVKRIGEVSFYCFVVYMIIAIVYNVLLFMNRPSEIYAQIGYDFKMLYIWVVSVVIPMFVAFQFIKFFWNDKQLKPLEEG